MHFTIQAQAAGKLAHFDSSASGIYDVINVCSTDEDEEGGNGLIQPPLKVVCDMDTDGGGWIIIMKRRRDVLRRVSFYREWDDYENGFGNLNSEFWIGLRNIHCLTKREDVDLLIDLRENLGDGMTWIYHLFKVNGSNDKYRLQIGEAEGPPGAYDAMAFHNGKQFTTRDSDNDGIQNHNCAQSKYGGWWYGPGCFHPHGSHLTGPIHDAIQWDRLLWYTGSGGGLTGYKHYRNVVMKIRPKRCAKACKNI